MAADDRLDALETEGRSPALADLDTAARAGALTAAVVSARGSELARRADHAIEVPARCGA